MTVAIQPGSAEWNRIITPSKVPSILGLSRFDSPYSMWRRMRGELEPKPASDIFDTGHDMEWAMAQRYRREHPGWQISPGEVQIVRDDLPFPAMVTLDRRARRGRARRIVEMKTARGEDTWGAQFTDEPPADYVAQVMAQMILTGYTDYPAHLMAMNLIGCHVYTYEIPFDQEIAGVIVERCADFYRSLGNDDAAPDLDNAVATYEAIREIHPDINGETVEIDPLLAEAALHYNLAEKDAKVTALGFKTRLLDAMGDAQTAMCGDVKIADRRPNGKSGVSLYLTTKNLDQLRTTTEGDTAA